MKSRWRRSKSCKLEASFIAFFFKVFQAFRNEGLVPFLQLSNVCVFPDRVILYEIGKRSAHMGMLIASL